MKHIFENLYLKLDSMVLLYLFLFDCIIFSVEFKCISPIEVLSDLQLKDFLTSDFNCSIGIFYSAIVHNHNEVI